MSFECHITPLDYGYSHAYILTFTMSAGAENVEPKRPAIPPDNTFIEY
jgi:hypothetical protein